MLRRVARVWRLGLLALGLATLACFGLQLHGATPVGSGHAVVSLCRGVLVIEHDEWRYDDDRWLNVELPRLTRESQGISYRPDIMLSLPLWLLSAICLAWPVTSFLIARRRHKRGFAVEPASPSQAPEVRQEREPGASPRVGGGG